MNADVVVVGGGPAGAAIANRLAALGYGVVVVEACRFPRPHVGESLHRHALGLLEPLGVLNEFMSAGFLPTRGSYVHWGGEAGVRNTGEFQLDRARFDELLLRAAARSGARVLQPARIQEFVRASPGCWEMTAEVDAATLRLGARFLVDAAGRRGLLPGSRIRLGAVTMALHARWPNIAMDRADTLVEAGDNQWYWAGRLPDRSVNVMVFAEPERVRRSDQSIGMAYLQLLRMSPMLSGWLVGPAPLDVQACSATASRVAEPVGEDWIKVGEAAIAYDPLSSQGVQQAIASGLQASAVANTLLSHASSQLLAGDFYRARVDESAAQHAYAVAQFYEQQMRYTPTPFWIERSRKRDVVELGADGHRAEPAGGLPVEILLAVNPLAQWLEQPVVLQDRIVAMPALTVPGRRPVVWIDGEPINELVENLGPPATANRLVERISRRVGARRAYHIVLRLWRTEVLCVAQENHHLQDYNNSNTLSRNHG